MHTDGNHIHSSTPLSQPVPKHEWFEWLVLVAIFLVVGTIGHDPWGKKSEPYMFGIIYDFYNTHTWLIPTDAGVPFMEKPPLYAWVATVLCRLLHTWLPLYDAARLASVFFMGIAMVFLWKSAHVFFRQHKHHDSLPWTCVALFLGTYGVSHWTHEMITDVPFLTGTTIAMYGMAILCMTPEYSRRAGVWIGLGMGVAFMAKGLFMPAVLCLSGLIAWCVVPELRRKDTLKAVLIAILAALPFFVVWPALVYQYSHSLFMEWFWDNNVGRFLGFSVAKLGAENDRGRLLANLPVFTFPLLPLAVAKLVYIRKEWRKPQYCLPLIIAVIGFVLLLASATARIPYILPLLPSLALLGAPALTRITPRPLIVWNTLARIAFTVTTAGMWLIWWNLLHPVGQRPFPQAVKWFDGAYPPDFVVHASQPLACVVALTVTGFWVLSLRIRAATALDTARIWFAGAALVWCTSYTLLMPWTNEARSFRSAIVGMQNFVDHSPYAGGTICNWNLGENMAPMVSYFLGLKAPLPMIDSKNVTCSLALAFTPRDYPVDTSPEWKLLWHGTRLRDVTTAELRLYTHKAP